MGSDGRALLLTFENVLQLRNLGGVASQEMCGLLEQMKAVNSSIESQATELREFMRAVGLEPPPVMSNVSESEQDRDKFVRGGNDKNVVERGGVGGVQGVT